VAKLAGFAAPNADGKLLTAELGQAAASRAARLRPLACALTAFARTPTEPRRRNAEC
jgi:hypothetical protein